MVFIDIDGDTTENFIDERGLIVAIADIAICDLCVADKVYTDDIGDSSENWTDIN